METPKEQPAAATTRSRKIKLTNHDREKLVRLCRAVGRELEELAKLVGKCGGNHALPAGQAKDLMALKAMGDAEELVPGKVYLAIAKLLGDVPGHGERNR